jgi:hypothetical protein
MKQRFMRLSQLKKKIVVGAVVTMAVLLVFGAGMLAAASVGTQDDPFITLSYLTDIFKPQVMRDATAAEQEMTKRFDEQISAFEAQMKAGQGGQTAPTDKDKFTVVTLSRNQVLVCPVGTEIMLRIGTATANGSSAPALVNYTTGATLSNGAALTVNNMYLVTIEGNGVKATAATVRVVVRGNYTIR